MAPAIALSIAQISPVPVDQRLIIRLELIVCDGLCRSISERAPHTHVLVHLLLEER